MRKFLLKQQHYLSGVCAELTVKEERRKGACGVCGGLDWSRNRSFTKELAIIYKNQADEPDLPRPFTVQNLIFSSLPHPAAALNVLLITDPAWC